MSRLIAFDLDGTLVDSRRDLANSINELLSQYGARPLEETEVGRMVGDGASVLVTRAFAAAGIPQPSDALDRFLRIYDDHLLDFTRAYDGLHDVLAALRTRAELAVLTNKPLHATWRVLTGVNLARYFPDDRVIGGDGPFARKPDPGGLRHLIRLAASTPAATTMVGDSAIDWRTAHNAGARSCLARYGFGYAGFPVQELRSDDLVIDTAPDLLRVL